MNDDVLAPRLGPLLRLRSATAQLLAAAEAALEARDPNQDSASVERLRQQLGRFDAHIHQLQRTLPRANRIPPEPALCPHP